MDSLISVIVPVYNVGEYLSRCVDSILKQTYSNLEIILVDDGSTDDSGHICDTYIPRDSRIRVIHKKNGGLSSARNAGIEKAKGEYLSFIDSDDYIHPEFYERLYTAIMENDADVAVCNFKQVAHGTETDTGERKVSKFVGKQSIMDNFYNSNCAASVVAWNKLYKRSVFGQLRYKPGIIHEDEELTYRILYSSNCAVYLSDTLYYYYVRENSITMKPYAQRNLQMFDVLKSIIVFYDEHREKELRKKAVIRYFKILQLHMLRVERECQCRNVRVSENELYKTLRKYYIDDLHYYHMRKYKVLFDLYGWLKRMKAGMSK